MFGWLQRLRPPVRPPAAPRTDDSSAPAPQPVPEAAAARGTVDESDEGGSTPAPHTLAWLLDAPATEGEELRAAEVESLAAIDALLASPRLPPGLLPRAASVIPQLIAMLRQEQPSRPALARQIARDPVLTAEVLRVARSPMYRIGDGIETLDAAIAILGHVGIQSAIARVLLRPVFDGTGGGLAARSAERTWQHAELKAAICARLAADVGIERFEGYLAGLLHNTGWTVALRGIDRAAVAPVLPPTAAFARALESRRDRLFARLAAEWNVSTRQAALAAALERAPAAACDDPLAGLLLQSDREATLQLAGSAKAH
jgi:hypothetical protein